MLASRSTRSEIIGALAAGFIVVFFCLILLWHDPLVFWNDDYELSVLPVFADMARSWSEGHWPILSPYSWVCGNLAGEFQYGTFSLFVNAAVILIWKFPLTFPQQAAALSIAHLFALAVGAFLLARDRGISVSLSIFVALIASLNGWIICWGASDWFGALGAFTWLPWAWWGAERALDSRRTQMAIPLAGAVCLSARDGRISLHGFDAAAPDWSHGWSDQVRLSGKLGSILAVLPMLVGVALGFGFPPPRGWRFLIWFKVQPASCNRPQRIGSGAFHRRLCPGLILPSWTVNWTDFSSRSRAHTAAELACGLVAPAALIAGLVWRARQLVRQIKWELVSALDRAFALHDSNRRPFPLEFSMAAVFPSRPRNLRGGGVATRGRGHASPLQRRLDSSF